MSESLFTLNDAVTRTISCENKDGAIGKGAMADPLPGSPGEHLGRGWKSSPFVTIPAGSTYTMADITGEGEIKSIWLTGEVDRGLIIRMYWDGQENPSVECPVTDFFLYGFAKPHTMERWNDGPYYTVNSALMAVNPNRGLNCYIPMPYRHSARITLENRSEKEKVLYYQVNFEEKKMPENIGYFHAQYRISMPVPYKGVHTVLDGVEGQGRYLGTALYVGLNRAARWWGEGEFKFYLDDDKEYPSICTTGLEDYFCGAFNWDVEGEYKTYSHLYSGLPYIYKPDGLYDVQQRFCLYRWHVTDPIRFQKGIRITLQDLGWEINDEGEWKKFLQREDDFITVSYWYQTLPTQKFPELISHEDLVRRA